MQVWRNWQTRTVQDRMDIKSLEVRVLSPAQQSILSRMGIVLICRGGGIGRRAVLRWLWEKSCGGSSPLLGTNVIVIESRPISPACRAIAGLAGRSVGRPA